MRKKRGTTKHPLTAQIWREAEAYGIDDKTILNLVNWGPALADPEEDAMMRLAQVAGQARQAWGDPKATDRRIVEARIRVLAAIRNLVEIGVVEC